MASFFSSSAPSKPVGIQAQLEQWANTPIAITSSTSVKPIDLRIEFYVVCIAVAYIVLHFVGKIRNRKLTDVWCKEALPLINKEFATTAQDGQGKGELLLWNGGDEAVLYASGRRSVESMHAHFHLSPRHDPLLSIYHTIYDFALASPVSSSRDTLTLTFQLPATQDNTSGVFAIVDKSVLQTIRKDRPFDLSFARLFDPSGGANEERERRGLDRKWAVMTENAELTDSYLGEAGPKGDDRRVKLGLQAVLASSAGKWLESLIVTDLPQQRPEGSFSHVTHPRLLILNLRVPSNASRARETLPLFLLATNLLDAIELSSTSASVGISVTDRARAKLVKSRTDFEVQLAKEVQQEQKEQEEDSLGQWVGGVKKGAGTKTKDGRELTDKELAKRKEIEDKRARKKAQGKMSKVRS